MASIQRLKRGYRVKYREGGRGTEPKYITGLRTKDDAVQAKQRIEAELDARGAIIPGTLISLQQLLVRWERVKLSGRAPNDKAGTEEASRRMRRHCELMGWRTTLDVTPSSIATWRERQQGTTRVGSYLHALLAWGRDFADQVVDHRSLAALRPPRKARVAPQVLLTVDRVAEAFRQATAWSPDCGALIHCLATYGWRPITASRLSVGDLRGDRILTRVKGGHEVEHPLLEASLALLRPLCEGRALADPLFKDPRTGERWAARNPGTISAFCRDHLALQAYDLKRFAASHLLAAMEPHEAKLFTGHLTTTQLMLYPRSNKDSARAALSKLHALVGPTKAET